MLDLNYEPEEIVDTAGMSNDEWLKYRTTGLGGSDVAVLFGISPWTTKRSLYFNKIGMEKGKASNQYTLDFGHAVEAFVASWFQWGYDNNPKKYRAWLEKRIGEPLKSFLIYKDTVMYRHPLFPFLQSNLDYRFRAETISGKIINGIFECKTTNHNTFTDNWGWNKVPEYYIWQCRQYMSVMNVDCTIIACACGNNENDYAMGFVERDLDKEEELIGVSKNFWYNNILAKVAPPFAEDEEHAAKELDALLEYNLINTKEDGTPALPLSSEILDVILQYQTNAAQASAYEKKAKQLKDANMLNAAKIFTAMNQHNKGIIFNTATSESIEVVAKNSSRSGIDRDRLTRELPDVAKEYTKASQSTQLKIYVKAADLSKTA